MTATKLDAKLIENHGVIGNMRSAALVATDGAIDFFCYPAFDSPSVFAAILDEEKGGIFRIDPMMEEPRTRQMYLPDTNILLTRFLSDEGVAEITDFMPVSSEQETDTYAHHIFRLVRVIRGEIRFRLLCAPRFDYARARHTAARQGSGVVFRSQADVKGGGELFLQATVPLQVDERDAVAEFTLHSGESAAFCLGAPAADAQAAERFNEGVVEAAFTETMEFWRGWIKQSRYEGRWREVVNRSALALKLLVSREHGSLIAAATFGLPEQRGGSRNWDYRYTWLRDSSFTLYAFMRLGFTSEANAFTHWLRERFTEGLQREDGDGHGPLDVIYRINGGSDLEEISLDHLAGYGGSKPVRIGNGASSQLQLDVYGELMDSIYLANKYATAIPNEGWKRVCKVMKWLGDNWEREDDGIWEVRNGAQHFLHSRLMCWVAFDRAIRLAQKRSLVAPLAEWLAARDAIHEDIFANFWDEDLRSFVQSKGSKTLDAAILLMPMLRFISPRDPQWISTMAALEEHLTEDALVFRYSDGSDGLAGQEGSFIACSFWRIECLARQGEVEKARLLFDKMLGYANHLGLYAEELGKNGEQLGNFPQALTHLALISAATYLDRKLSSPNGATWE